jgi:hypothetical protein
MRVLDVDQAKRLLQAARETPLEAIVTVGLSCRLRLGEGLR